MRPDDDLAAVWPPRLLAKIDLKCPATTVAMFKSNAVVGIQLTENADHNSTQLGVTCTVSTTAQTYRPPAVSIEDMDTNTLLIVLVVLLILGGGGFFYRGRVRR